MAIRYLTGVNIDSNTLFVDSANNRVGIGTASPTAALHIVTGGSTQIRLQHDSWNYWDITSAYNTTNADLYFSMAGAEKFRINASGNVGIGTTSPAYKLDVSGQIRVDNGVGNGSGQALIVGGSGDVTLSDGGSLFFGAYDYGGSTYIRGYDSGDVMYFYSNGTNAVYFKSDRAIFSVNVGIGTTAPASILHVEGGSPTTNLIASSGNGFLRIADSATSATRKEFTILLDNTNNRVDIQAIQQGVAARNITLNASGGNVGIGTTSPLNPLFVSASNAGDYAAFIENTNSSNGYGLVARTAHTGTSAYAFAARAAATDIFVVRADGNVGIGTTSPSYKLHVNGDTFFNGSSIVSGNAQVLTINGTNHAYYAWSIANTRKAYAGFGSSGSTTFELINENTGGFIIGTNGGQQIIITSAGNVGIGTTSAATKFVVSNAGASGFEVDPAGGVGGGPVLQAYNRSTSAYMAQSYYALSHTFNVGSGGSTRAIDITSAGNVGIGTTSPTVTLEVSGRGLITSSGSSDTFAVTHSSGSGIGVNITKGGNGEGLYVNKTSGTGNAVTIVGTLNATTLVKSGGTSSQYLMADGSVSTLTNPVTGTGTTNYVPKWTSGSAIGNSAIYDNAGNIGVGIAAPQNRLSIGSAQDAGIDFLYDGFNNYKNQIKNYWNSGTDTRMDFNIGNTSGVAPVTVMSVGYGGNVGIGTTSPSALLTIDSVEPRFRMNRGGTQEIIINHDGTTGVFRTESNTPLAIGTNGSERIRITSAGNVGIGTTSPVKKFTVRSSDDTTNTFAGFYAENESQGVEIWYGGIQMGGSNGNVDFNIASKGTGNVLITNGNVGIGTTSPSVKLDVGGVVNASGGIVANSENFEKYLGVKSFADAVANRAINVQFGNFALGGRFEITITGTFSNANAGGGITKVFSVLTNPSNNIYTNESRVTTAIGPIVNNFAIGEFQWDSGSSQYIIPISHIVSSGNPVYVHIKVFGIGSTANVYNNVSLSDPYTLTSLSTTYEYYNNNLGIGTTSPSYLLDVAGTSRSDLHIFRSNQSAPTADAFIFRPADNTIALGTANSERMRITSAGNVGIGTTSPSEKLHVVGGNILISGLGYPGIIFDSDASSTNWSIYSSSSNEYFAIYNTTAATDVFAIKPDGSIGIGTITPTQRLHIGGNLRVTGAYYDSNNEAGTSGQVLTSTGSGTDWKSLSEITGVDGTGTANYVAKWSDTDTIANSQIRDDGTTVGIGTAPAAAKLTVNGPVNVGGRYLYNNFQEYLDTTGINVAGLSASSNGDSAFFTFEAGAGSGHYQRIVYSCYNAAGTWNVVKVIDEGTNVFDVVASASSGSTITFTWKTRSGIIYYTPRLIITGVGSIDTTYL